MDWLLIGWIYWMPVANSPETPDREHDQVVRASGTIFEPVPDLTVINLRLIALTYDFIAAQSHCLRCGNPLGRGQRVMSPHARYPQWTTSVMTRCRGWRRHIHIATVVEASNDLMLGPFRIH